MPSESTPNPERDALAKIIHNNTSAGLGGYPVMSAALRTADAVLAAGYRPQDEVKAQIMVGSRQSGKTRVLIDALLDRADERGIKVEIVEPETVAVDSERERCAAIVEKYWPINPFWADAISKRIRESPVTEEGTSHE